MILELANQGVEIDEINGEVPSARISGLTGLGLDVLEDKVIELSTKMKLFEDMECAAQCYVVETNVDEQGMVNACIVVKKGKLNLDDQFVCGTSEGRIKFMINDTGS